MFGITFSPLKAIAFKKKIPTRFLTPSRVGDLFYWSKDDIGNLPSNLEKKIKSFKKVNLSKAEKVNAIKRKTDLTDEIINTGLSTTNPKNTDLPNKKNT